MSKPRRRTAEIPPSPSEKRGIVAGEADSAPAATRGRGYHSVPRGLADFWQRPWVAVALIASLALAAWSNSLRGPFVFDDVPSIVENATIRDLGSGRWLQPPATAGETVSGRPILNLSFALNHAAGGLEVRGYHGVNLAIHVAAGLLLWAILRRLPRAGWAELALPVALLWVLHPLHTAAVTYVVQRAESLAGLFMLLAVYAFLRSAAEGARKRSWGAVAVLASFAAAGTKETAVALVPVLLLCDRLLLAGDWRVVWRERGRLHALLALSWVLLGALVLANRGRGGSAGWQGAIGPVDYALTQTVAIAHYLRLAVWPVGQTFDYGQLAVRSFAAAIVPLACVLGMLGASVWAALRRRPSGLLGIVFFLLLAPSSSVVPVATQTMAEHRMYLPLACLVIALVGAVSAWARSRRVPPIALVLLVATAAIALGVRTWQRNEVYRSAVALWTDTVARRPDNPRAHYNLGLALRAEGQVTEAAVEFQRTVALNPAHAFAQFQLATLALENGKPEEARQNLEAAIAADPGYATAEVLLGDTYLRLGRTGEAETRYRAALALAPAAPDIQVSLATVVLRSGRVNEADVLLREALAHAPANAEAHHRLGLVRERQADAAAAEREWREALRLDPRHGGAWLALGNLQAARGENEAAAESYQHALSLAPTAEAWFAQANLLARARRFDAAIDGYRRALALDPDHVQARHNWANCLLVTGRLDDAIAQYEIVAAARPDDAAVRENLALARRLREAR